MTSRRGFLKRLGIGAAGAGIAALPVAAAHAVPAKPEPQMYANACKCSVPCNPARVHLSSKPNTVVVEKIVERVVEVEVAPKWESVTLGQEGQYTVLPDGRVVSLNARGEGTRIGYYEPSKDWIQWENAQPADAPPQFQPAPVTADVRGCCDVCDDYRERRLYRVRGGGPMRCNKHRALEDQVTEVD